MTNEELIILETFEYYKGFITVEKMVQKLGEEVMELAMGIAAKDDKNIKEEIGDCLGILLHIAYKHNPDIPLMQYLVDNAIKMEINHK